MSEARESEEIIKTNAFHSYPRNYLGLNPSEPHAEDCEGCIIDREVEKLVKKLEKLSHVEEIAAELEKVREEKEDLQLERWRAFEKAGVGAKGSIADIVESLVKDKAHLSGLLRTFKNDINRIATKMKDAGL